MVNGSVINGSAINGEAGFWLSKDAYDTIYVNESLAFSFNYGLSLNETAGIIEDVKFSFNKGMPIPDTVEISETLDIQLGGLFIHISDDPIDILENLSFNLQKGILMEPYLAYYLNLLIIQYKNKTRAIQHVTALVKQALIDLMPLIVQNGFNFDTAQGVQLDILGKYIGVGRRVQTFTTDVTLGDDDYRVLLKIKRATNSIGSSLYDIDSFVFTNLNGIMKVFDQKDMSLSFYLSSTVISSVLAQAIVVQDILPRPMGVAYSEIVYIPSFENIFGFRAYEFDSGNQVGYNTYSNYNPTYRLLKYEDRIT